MLNILATARRILRATARLAGQGRRHVGTAALVALGLGATPALAVTSTVSVTFSNGFIGEYANGAQQPLHSVLFGTLNIGSVTISQTTDNGQFGGSQGNDYSVNLTVNYTNGTTVTCAAAVNWLDKSSGNFVEGIGFTTSSCNDGYTLSASRSKTYLLRTSASTRVYQATAVGVQATYLTAGGSSPVSGSSDTRGALGALNAELGTVPAVITGPSGGAGAASSQISVNENQTAVTQLTASEPVTWSITGGTDAGAFSIAADGTITFNVAPNYEVPTDSNTNNSYVLIVSARDSNGNVTTQTVTVFVLDVAEGGADTTPPTITGPSGNPGDAVSEISVNENQTGVTQMTASEAVTWSITGGADAGKFTISANGTITFNTAPDFEVPTDANTDNNYILVVTATDAAGNTSTQTVTVHVLNLNDTPPAITGPSGGAGAAASAITVNENQTAVTQVTAPVPVTWAITGGNDDGKFTIAPDGTITFIAPPDFEAPTDIGTNNTYVLTIMATDANGNTSTQTITVTVANLDDTPPAIAGPSGPAGATASALSVNENQTAVTKLTATEPVTWAITGGDDAGKFQIAPDGTITFVAAPDFEVPVDVGTNNTYTLIVTATDAAGNTSVQTITVTVLNVDDTAPTIVAGASSLAVSVNENQTAVTKLTANEPVTWSITGGVDAAKFQIAGDGTITFVAAPDFERPSDADANNVYVLVATATDANGNTSVVTVNVTVLDLDDTPPLIQGPSGNPGDATSAISVNENQTAVTKVTANEAVSWSISGGADAAKFQIAADGTITFRSAPDFERPTDADTNNVYVLTVTATDGSGNVSVQTISVTVLDLDDTAPLIRGPSGNPGDLASALSVNENQTGVTRVTANETVTWSISGGTDAAKFQIAADGTITFTAAPDFERPTDIDTNNTYVLIVTATDAAGNRSSQTVTVTVLNVDDTAPLITGPSGGAGASASALAINEGLTAVTTFTANEPVTWAIVGGADASAFSIDSATGALVFRAAPDFENPTDSDRNNSYVVQVRAVDAAGNVSIQTLTVTILNVDEISRKIAEISGRLRSGLRGHALHSLGDMLSFNEDLVRAADDDDGTCSDKAHKKPLSGGLNANDTNQQARLGYAGQLNKCGRPFKVLVNAGLAVSRFDGNWTTRGLGSVRVERRIGSDVTLGLGVLATTASDTLTGFADSHISDTSVQLNLYGRAKLAEKLRGGAFAGIGKSWYSFGLHDTGLDLTGKMTGDRYIYGAMLSGDMTIGGVLVTTDAILSHATEHLGSATLAAAYRGESRSDIAFAVGNVDTTRISVPVTGQFLLSGNDTLGGGQTKLLLSPGLLCEDASVESSSLVCGYQFGAKVNTRLATSGNAYLDYKFESVNGQRRNMFGLGYARRFGSSQALEVALDLNHGTVAADRADSRAMIRLRVSR
ncbi:cadherin repeat domain-containing protein [Chakrabartia godavariana]|nr:cadherin repeat domain-containing protein [Chakrabartia godavariana]